MKDQYDQRLFVRSIELGVHGFRDKILANSRLVVFGVVLVVGWAALVNKSFSPNWTAVPLLVFVYLVALHHRVIEKRIRADRAVSFYEAGIARIEDKWVGQGNPGERFADTDHLYAADLDLFGKASLFELLCTTRTRAGEETLADWLKEPASREVASSRQRAVRELAPELDLREDVAVLGDSIESGLHPDTLGAWGGASGAVPDKRLRIAAGFFPLIALGALALALYKTALVLFGLQAVFALLLLPRVKRIVKAAEESCAGLDLFSELLALTERKRFESGALAALQRELETEGKPPTRRIAQLRRTVDRLEARRNLFFAPVGALLLWTTQTALAVEAWRATYGGRLAGWLRVTGEFEALCSLGTYACEHENDAFPQFAEDGPLFDGKDLGHPLIPDAECVRNDVRLDAECSLLLVSGSNMSGKSTLLRTVGTAAVMAQLGAPVRASSLTLSPLKVGASLRTLDSLQEHKSRFYAEITRIRNIVGLTGGERPLLFLLDEVLMGTNSRDRRIGAEAVVKGLLDAGAIGLVTTHDLSLTEVAEELAPKAENVHFQDELVDGEMRFDYRLQPGVVTRSNALELMRAIGLKV